MESELLSSRQRSIFRYLTGKINSIYVASSFPEWHTFLAEQQFEARRIYANRIVDRNCAQTPVQVAPTGTTGEPNRQSAEYEAAEQTWTRRRLA